MMRIKKITAVALGCMAFMQSISAFAYDDISVQTIRKKQLDFASQYEYREGDFDKSFEMYPEIIYTSGLEYTQDGKVYECPAIYIDEHAKYVSDYELNEKKARFVINNVIDSSVDKCILYNSRLLVPSQCLEKVGCDVFTDADTYVTTISKNDTVLEILPNLIGMRKNRADGFYVPLEVCARIIDDNLYIPIRAVADELGLYIQWDSETNTATLSD